MTNENTQDNDAPAPKKKTWLWIVGGVVVLGLFGSIFSGGNDNDTADAPASVSEDEAEAIQQEEEDADESDVQIPESFNTVEELEAAIIATLGDETNTGLDRDVVVRFDSEESLLVVTFVANENLTTNMTRRGMWRDIASIFDLARKWDPVDELTVTAQYPLISNLGEELGPQDVLTAYFDTEVYPRINTDNLPGERLGEAATFVRVHPALQ
jgi:hypothetical protein